MSDIVCPACGAMAMRAELAPLAHSPQLLGCRACRARIAATGHHQRPFDPRRHQAAYLKAITPPASDTGKAATATAAVWPSLSPRDAGDAEARDG